jgi:hypothetical protein
MEEPRDLHRLLVVLYDVDAEPAARVEAAGLLLRAIAKQRTTIDALTRRSFQVAIARALRDTRADLIRAQKARRITEGHA